MVVNPREEEQKDENSLISVFGGLPSKNGLPSPTQKRMSMGGEKRNKDEAQKEYELSAKLSKTLTFKMKNRLFKQRAAKIVFIDALLKKKQESGSLQMSSVSKRSPDGISNKSPSISGKSKGRSNTVGESIFTNGQDIREEEANFVDSFFSRFVIVSESSISDHIDIIMFLKALP